MALKEDFERDGVVVIRQAVPIELLRLWQWSWDDWYDAQFQFGRKPSWNPVDISGPFPDPLASMPQTPALLDIVEQVFGPDIALYNHRFVVKDKAAKGVVFPHQDTGYHVGFMQKASLFVALTEMHTGNGGMVFMRGSHKWGYLGDAGEISNEAILARAHAGMITDGACHLMPGDCVLMHSACWHASLEHRNGPNRVLADIIYQPASDPSGIKLLRGKWQCEPQPWLREGGIFKRSRTSRIKELEAKVAPCGDVL